MANYKQTEVREGIRKRLYGYTTEFDTPDDTIRARLFGFMVDLAADTVKDYRSDFYRDAKWIKDYIHGETTFAYGAREGGTYISDAEYWSYAVPFNEKVWLIKITEDDGEWFATAIQVK